MVRSARRIIYYILKKVETLKRKTFLNEWIIFHILQCRIIISGLIQLKLVAHFNLGRCKYSFINIVPLLFWRFWSNSVVLGLLDMYSKNTTFWKLLSLFEKLLLVSLQISLGLMGDCLLKVALSC